MDHSYKRGVSREGYQYYRCWVGSSSISTRRQKAHSQRVRTVVCVLVPIGTCVPSSFCNECSWRVYRCLCASQYYLWVITSCFRDTGNCRAMHFCSTFIKKFYKVLTYLLRRSNLMYVASEADETIRNET